MGRAALFKTKLIIIATVVIAAAGGGAWAYIANSPSHKVETVANMQHQLTQISYHGHDGIDALTLLKQHAAVQTKHYSFGDLVTSINGSVGSGPKYWTFYVNGKEASVGAGAYHSKNSDTLMWRLQ